MPKPSGSERPLWKLAEEHPLTHTMAHYLLSIHHLRTRHDYARITDVAEQLGITRATVSVGIKALRQKGLVVMDTHRMLQLTPDGEAWALALECNRERLFRFFTQVLEVPEAEARLEACRLEYLVSPQLVERLAGCLLIPEVRQRPTPADPDTETD